MTTVPFQQRSGKDTGQRALFVLIAEDSQSTADILGMFFESQGHVAKVVYNGRDAVNEALAQPPDLILMDLGMPEMNGLEAAIRIRHLQCERQPSIIALTGFDDDEMIRRCHHAGFDGHLAKPADPEELKRIIASLLREPQDATV